MAESRPASREIEIVRELIESVRAGQARDPILLAEAQERGFGALMALEARLQRAQRHSADVVAGPGDGARGPEIDEIRDAINELAHALTELRDLASPAGGPSRVGYGFVLPRPLRRVTPAPRPSQA